MPELIHSCLVFSQKRCTSIHSPAVSVATGRRKRAAAAAAVTGSRRSCRLASWCCGTGSASCPCSRASLGRAAGYSRRPRPQSRDSCRPARYRPSSCRHTTPTLWYTAYVHKQYWDCMYMDHDTRQHTTLVWYDARYRNYVTLHTALTLHDT